jgi:hypothetical protein
MLCRDVRPRCYRPSACFSGICNEGWFMASVSLRNWLDWHGAKMIKDLVVHIGDPKTGTSSIQKALQLGACKSETTVIAGQPELNASPLANSLRPRYGGPAKRQGQFRKTAAWVQETEADLGIISSEFMAPVLPSDLKDALQEFLPEQASRTRVIAYVRPHVGRLLSGYAQRLKAGSYGGTLEQFTKQLEGQGNLMYAQRFGRWRTQFGDGFILRPFVREEMRGGDVVEDFFHHVLQGASFTLDSLPSTNEALTLEELAGMAMVQRHFRQQGMKAHIRLSLGGCMGRLLAQVPGRSRQKLRMPRALAIEIRKTYRADAELLDAEFFGRPVISAALERAEEGCLEQAQSLTAETYFQVANLATLQQLANQISSLIAARPKAWRQSYQKWIGQLPQDSKPLGKAGQKNADEVWVMLQELAEVLAKGRAV